MKIVELLIDDISDILKLYANNFSDGWNENMLRSAFKEGRFLCFGAKQDGEIMGVVSITVGDTDADIEGVVTKKEFLRKGVAKTLIKYAIQKLKALKKEKVFLEVREGNLPAVSLYEYFGFKPISVRKKYYFDGENALVMVKEI